MGTLFDVKTDLRGLPLWRASVISAATRAASMAGSSAIKAMRAEGSRQIRERKALKVAAVNEAIVIGYPTRGGELVWRASVKSEAMPVAAFPYRQTRAGVSVQINKGSRKVIRGAFEAKMASGHVGVFTARGPKRVISRGRYKGKYRRPIKEAFTTRISEEFVNSIPAMAMTGRTVFSATFARVLPLELAKRSR